MERSNRPHLAMRSLFLYLLLKNSAPRSSFHLVGLLVIVLLGLAWLPFALVMAGTQELSEVSRMDGLKDVNTPEAQMQRADYFYYNGGWLRSLNSRAADDKALSSYEAVITRFPQYVDLDKAYLGSGELYQRRGDYQQALARHSVGLQITQRRDYIPRLLLRGKLVDDCCIGNNCQDSRRFLACFNSASATALDANKRR